VEIPHALTCQYCHGGQPDNTFADMTEAHADMVVDPSAIGESGCTACHAEFTVSACNACHPDEVAATANSLHTNLWGEKKAIEVRGRCTFEGSGFEDYFDSKCNGCHTTCGQCHISRPNSVGGGFPKTFSYLSHTFSPTPHITEQCTACHGSRVGIDYLGEIEGNQADIHRSRGHKCELCHGKDEIHGDGQHEGDHYEHRYEVASMPRCEDCHSGISNEWHDAHVDVAGANLQCQVCHSQPYKNCTNCHNLVADGKTDKFEINPSRVQFKIAQNPSPHRDEYDFVLVRHVPIDPGTYADWGLDLPGYLDEPTWRYTSPHNILERTPQTTVEEGLDCFSACHATQDSPDGWFLRESDLYEEGGGVQLPDYDANIGIVIREDFPDKE